MEWAIPMNPTIVVLCGSTRFMDTFQMANLTETLKGNIVLSVGCNTHCDQTLFSGLPEDVVRIIKERLDTLHLRKIDMADEVLILNLGGYIGASTQRELDYAIALGKRVRYLEPVS
jgi:hypothetical protein